MSFRELAACFRARDEIIRFLAHAAAGFAAMILDELFDLTARVFFQRSGDDDRFSDERAFGRTLSARLL